MLPYYVALVAGIILGVAGQVALKLGADGTKTIALQFLHPATIIGFAIYVAAAVLYMIAIKKIPISLAYPSVSIGYVIVASSRMSCGTSRSACSRSPASC